MRQQIEAPQDVKSVARETLNVGYRAARCHQRGDLSNRAAAVTSRTKGA